MVWKLKPVSEYHRCPSLSSPGLKDHSCNLSWLIGISRPPRLKHHSGKKWKREREALSSRTHPWWKGHIFLPKAGKCFQSEKQVTGVRKDYSGVASDNIDKKKKRFKQGTSQDLVVKKCSVKSSWWLSLDRRQEGCSLEVLEEMPQEEKTRGKRLTGQLCTL